MRVLLGEMIKSYGDTVQLEKDGKTETVQAFIQPITSRARRNMERAFGSLGEIPQGQFLYLGPAEAELAGAEAVYWRKRPFCVRRSEILCWQDKPLYCWGLLTPAGEEDPWNS